MSSSPTKKPEDDLKSTEQRKCNTKKLIAFVAVLFAIALIYYVYSSTIAPSSTVGGGKYRKIAKRGSIRGGGCGCGGVQQSAP